MTNRPSSLERNDDADEASLPIVPSDLDVGSLGFRGRAAEIIAPRDQIMFLRSQVVEDGDASKVYDLVTYLDKAATFEPELVREVYLELAEQDAVILHLALSFVRISEASIPLIKKALAHNDGAVRKMAQKRAAEIPPEDLGDENYSK